MAGQLTTAPNLLVGAAMKEARLARRFYHEPFEGFTALAALAALVVGIIVGAFR